VIEIPNAYVRDGPISTQQGERGSSFSSRASRTTPAKNGWSRNLPSASLKACCRQYLFHGSSCQGVAPSTPCGTRRSLTSTVPAGTCSWRKGLLGTFRPHDDHLHPPLGSRNVRKAPTAALLKRERGMRPRQHPTSLHRGPLCALSTEGASALEGGLFQV
jgi:hypothetical protein